MKNEWKPIIILMLNASYLNVLADYKGCSLYCEKDPNSNQVCCIQSPAIAAGVGSNVNLKKKVDGQAEQIVSIEGQIKEMKLKVNKLADVNKCNTTLCTHGNCVNLPGDYFCICHYGYPGTDRRSCLLPRSCQEIFDKENMASGTYDISPDGVNTLTVKCNMTFLVNKRMTEISHDMAADTVVQGEAVKSWHKNIKYNGNWNAILLLVDRSLKCKQSMKYKCQGATMTSSNITMRNPWVDRNGADVNKFAGAKTENACPCFEAGNCATNSKNEILKCNCDVDDLIWREDSGYVTDRNLLPVKKVYGSDTGDADKALYTLGPLQCWG